MIILLGPDNTGKTTLTQKFVDQGFNAYHAVRETEYEEYLNLISGPKSVPIPLEKNIFIPGDILKSTTPYILDRFFFCELPYSKVVRKETVKFSLKQWHNLYLQTIAYNPLVILCSHKDTNYKDDYIPEEYFPLLLNNYQYTLDQLHIPYIKYDWEDSDIDILDFISTNIFLESRVSWWYELAKSGIAGIGNTVDPQVMILAEILSSNNIHHLPFEGGPSGQYLSELIHESGISLNSFYLTNFKKVLDSEENNKLLRQELRETKVKHCIVLGREAQKAQGVLESIGVEMHYLPHPGWVVNHATSPEEKAKRKAEYLGKWNNVWQEIPGIQFEEEGNWIQFKQ